MSRVIRLRVLSVLICLALSLIARSAAATEPTSEQVNQGLKGELARVQVRLNESPKQVKVDRTEIQFGTLTLNVAVPATIIPQQPSLYLNLIPPARQPRQGWILRNQNSNTWHYLVPVGP